MSKPNDGGPAFPVENDAHKEYNYIEKGMTLRDYFAAKALAIVRPMYKVTQSHSSEVSQIQASLVAQEAYQVADAMLLAREGKVAIPKDVKLKMPPGLQKEAKFEPGDPVQVDKDASGKLAGRIAVVDTAKNDPREGWVYCVCLAEGDGSGITHETYREVYLKYYKMEEVKGE